MLHSDLETAMSYPIKILGIGKASPSKVCYSTDIDRQHNFKLGYTQRLTGLEKRHFLSEDESADSLSLHAIKEALDDANLSLDAIDCIINASATPRQALPFNAAATHHLLQPARPIASFDINMTCLSALRALDIAARLFDSYPRILIVTCDIASAALDWSDIRSAGIFSDGATAMIVSKSEQGGMLLSAFETHSEGYEHCVIKGGGYQLNPHNYEGDYRNVCYFQMQGKELYKLTIKELPRFIQQHLESANLTLADIDWLVPHQASHAALSHMQRILAIPANKLINVFSSHGNQIASSIPAALHTLLRSKQLKSGQYVLFVGTSAGVGLGLLLWQAP